MKEESWYKMFVVALVLHAILIGGFSIPFRKAIRRLDISPYSVNLVTDVGEGPRGAGPKSAAGPTRALAKKEPPSPPTKKQETKQPAKVKPVPKATEKERSIPATKERTLAPKKSEKAPEPAAPSKDEVKSLDQRIEQMRTRNPYMDVVGGGKEGPTARGPGSTGTGFGSGGVGSGGGSLEEKYANDVWEKIQEIWAIPNILSLRKDLQTKMTVKVRRDGRIMDWTIDERSTSRMYDESIVRALRAIDRVPPIPDALNKETIELKYMVLPPSARR